MKFKSAAGLLIICFLAPLAGAQEDSGETRELEEITVTGTRTEKRLKDSPVVTEVITPEEIENSSAATVTDILEDYGIMFTGDAMGDYVQLQGMGESRVLFLIDGRRLVGRIASRIKGETMPLGNVERIEIVRGPQSALYGSDGIGGVINIITKKPGDKLSLSAALTNSFILAYDDPETKWKPSSPFEKFDPLREQNLAASAGFPLANTRNIISLEGGRAGYYYGEKQEVSNLPAYLRGKLGFDTAADFENGSELRAGGSFLLMQSDEKTNARGSLNRLGYIRADGYAEFEFMPLDWGILNIRLYDNFYQRDKDTYSGFTQQWIKGDNHEYENLTSLEVMGTYEGFSHFILTAGLEGIYNFMNKYNLQNDGAFAGVDRESLFFQAEYFQEDRYSVIAGVRGERSSQFGVTGTPKLSGMYHVTPEFRVLGGAGLGYRAPDFNDLYLVKDDQANHPLILGNKDLKPEYALGFNAGLEYAKQGKFFVQLNGYYTELFNEIAYIDQGYEERGMEVYKNENILRSLRGGIDMEGRVTLPKYFSLSAGYSWLYAYDRTEKEEMHLQPAHTVKMKLGWDYQFGEKKPAITAYLRARFFSPLDPGDSDDKSRFIMDFYLAGTFARHFKISLSIDNITGTIDPLGPNTAQAFTIGFKYFL